MIKTASFYLVGLTLVISGLCGLSFGCAGSPFHEQFAYSIPPSETVGSPDHHVGPHTTDRRDSTP